MQSLSIEELTTRAQAGDRWAMEEIVKRTYQSTYTLALRIVGDPTEASDITQDVYLRVQRSLNSFRGESKLSTWLYRVTANCCHTHMSKKSKTQTEELDVHAESLRIGESAQTDTYTNVIGLRNELSDAIASLPYRLRSVIVLRDIYDLTHQQIADELDITPAATKVRLHRARQKLRTKLYPSLGSEYAQSAARKESNDAV